MKKETIMKDKKPTIYTVATAHLDTVWNWDFEKTISSYIPATLDDNFKYFEKYPEYVFSFEGSYRYELMEEYYPEKFEKLKEYIAKNRWFVTGSAFENGDVNVPSPEALFRNILYGNSYFYEKFGKKSVDIYLPDCFGFGYALPSVISHAGLMGFTTQKLTWSSAYGIPFDLGKWQGVDGSQIYASLDAQDYSACITSVRNHKNAPKKLKNNIEKYDLPMTYLLHGTGDRGGAPHAPSVKTVVTEKRKNGKSDIDAEIVSIDKVFRIMDSELSDEQKAKLPVWNNELVSTDHGVGGYTSRAIGKRWNRMNEQLADAAERYSVLASWLGAADYPQCVLDKAWKRVIAHQFHDDLPGTSLERVYKRSWNDYSLSLNNFSGVYENAVSRIAAQMKVPFKKGVAVSVTNPTGWASKGAVACKVALPEGTQFVRVKNADGKAVPSQYNNGEVVFTASVPANGIAVYCVTAADKPYSENTGLSVTEKTLENRKYKVALDGNGDICSVFDKALGRELLKAPIRMGMHKYNGSFQWPAWELDYPEVMAEPIEFAGSPVFEIKENGAARAVIETRRTAGGSEFIQTVSLDEAGDTVRIYNEIEWRSSRRLLKTPFTFTVSNQEASYDLGLGVIRRGLNTPKLYEVPGQNFADISSEEFGVSVLSDSKYGWDHPTEDTLRLTGIHTPRGNFRPDSQQSKMDLGLNRYAFGVFSHAGDALNETQRAGAQFNQPMRAFAAPIGNTGSLPAEYSFASLSDDGVIIRAIKKEYRGNRIIVRVNEGMGIAHEAVRLTMGGGIAKAWAMNASEEVIGEAVLKNGELVFDAAAFEPKTFALELVPFDGGIKRRDGEALRLAYNVSATSANDKRIDGIFCGCTLPAEQFCEKVVCKSSVFKLSQGRMNAVRCGGQSISVPAGTKSVALLLTSLNGDKTISVRSGEKASSVFVPDCCEAIGAWDLYSMNQTGYIKQCTLAKEFTHLHNGKGDVIAKQCYLFSVEVPADGASVTLPVDDDVIVFAAEAHFEEISEGALAPLYDTLEKKPFDYKRSEYEDKMTRHDKLINALRSSKLFKDRVEKL